jgi:hypothetical protein
MSEHLLNKCMDSKAICYKQISFESEGILLIKSEEMSE